MSYLLARTVSLFIAGYFPDEVFEAPHAKSSISIFDSGELDVSVNDIIKRNFFDATESTFDKEVVVEDTKPDLPEAPEVINNDEAVKTSLSMTLVSTVSFGNGENTLSSSVVEASRKSEVYAVGDVLPFPQTKVVRILPRRIEFLNKGRLEYTEIPEDKIEPKSLDDPKPRAKGKRPRQSKETEKSVSTEEGIKQNGNHFIVKNALVQDALKKPELLYRQVRAMPHYDAGKPSGFKFFKVSRRSIFHKLGVRRGDIVKNVNGRTLDIQTGMKTFAELKDMKNFELDLVRKGVEQKFTYEVVD
jgi:type II secretion system protein C